MRITISADLVTHAARGIRTAEFAYHVIDPRGRTMTRPLTIAEIRRALAEIPDELFFDGLERARAAAVRA